MAATIKTSGLPKLLTEVEAAAALGLKPQTLALWRCQKRYGLPYLKLGHSIRYREDDLLRYLEESAVVDSKQN